MALSLQVKLLRILESGTHERMEDLPALADQLLRRICPASPCTLAPAALEVLRRHAFPGNVRELLNVLQHGCLLADDRVIRPEHLPEEVLAAVTDQRSPTPLATARDQVEPLAEIERRYLTWALERFRGDRAELARRLGLSSRTLYRKLASSGRAGPEPAIDEPSRASA